MRQNNGGFLSWRPRFLRARKVEELMIPATTDGASVERPEYIQRQNFLQLLRNDLGFIPVLLTLLIIVIFFTFRTNGIFLWPRNISDLLQQIVNIGIDGLALTFVLLLGEIDLSVAAVGTFGAGVVAVLAERFHIDPWVAIAAGLAAGALAGLINGIVTALLRVPSFIVTLASSIFYSGLLLTLLAGQSTLKLENRVLQGLSGSQLSFLPDWLAFGLPTLILVITVAVEIWYWRRRVRAGLRHQPLWLLLLQLGAVVLVVEGLVILMENTPSSVPGYVLGIPNGVAILFGLIYSCWLLITRTRFGRHLYAVGGNPEAARRAGIKVASLRVIAFTLCSTLAVAGGILASSRGNGVASAINPTLLLNAVAAAVIGGVSLFGGRGSFWAVALGALVIGSVENGLTLQSASEGLKQMVEGGVLVVAVIVDAVVRRLQKQNQR